jgi:antitoxin component YwqK of YwqJK toxin-antitoxin module
MGAFVQGLQDGPWERYHASGELLDRGVRVGKKTGEWVAFDRTGKQQRTTNHREVP